MRKFTLALLVCCSLLYPDTFAAFPVKEQQKQERATQKLYQQITEASSKYNDYALRAPSPAASKETEKEGSVVFGIFSLVFGVLGIFPAAIVLGILGMNKHRKYRGLAIAGFVLGMVALVLFVLLLVIHFMVMAF